MNSFTFSTFFTVPNYSPNYLPKTIYKMQESHTKSEFNEKLAEAMDIVKFLSTLERYLKTLTYSNDIAAIKDCISGLMKGFKLVWVVSRSFAKNDRMVRILARSAWQLKVIF